MRWDCPALWSTLFTQSQECLGFALSHLDDRDPVRRRSTSLRDDGRFVCDFGPKEESRWIFGRFTARGLDFSLVHHRDMEHWYNYIHFHVPRSLVQKKIGWSAIKAAFDRWIDLLRPFYATADFSRPVPICLHPELDLRPRGFNVELPQVGWLTYLGRAYVEHFGHDRVNALPCATLMLCGGVRIKLADSPLQVLKDDRETLMAALGRSSFYDETDGNYKLPGQYVLTLQQLRRHSELHPG